MKRPQWTTGLRWLRPSSIAAVCGIWLMLIGLGSTANAQVAADKASEPVVLERYTVSRGGFNLSGDLMPGTAQVRSMKVTWVGPKATKAGLRTKDELISVDRVSIKGMPLKQLTELLDMDLAPGNTRVFHFLGRRGLLRKEVYVELTYTGEAKPAAEAPGS